MFGKIFSTILISTALVSCNSMSDLARNSGGQSINVSGYSYNQVWDASIATLKNEKGSRSLDIDKDISIYSSDKSKGEIIANTGFGLASYGEVIGVFITPPKNASSHKIEVQSKAKMATNVFANDWEGDILSGINKRLKQGK